MSTLTCTLRPTRAYAGLLLHRLFVSPVSYIVYAALLAPLVWTAYNTQDYTNVCLVAGLLFFGLHVEALFIRHELEDDSEPVLDPNNLGCYVTFDLVKHLHGRGNLHIDKFFRAAVHAKRSAFVLHMLGLEKKDLLQRCAGKIPHDNVQEFLTKARDNARKLEQERISAPIVLLTLLQSGGVFDDVLNASELSLQDVEEIVQWEVFRQKIDIHEWVFHPNRIVRTFGTMGRSWVQGYTNDLDRISEDISGRVSWRTRERGVMIHKQELESAVHILSRTNQKNLLLVGQTGTGKRTMLENIGTLLRKEEMKHGRALSRLLLLKTEEILSGDRNADRVLLKALKKAEKSGKFILIIENLSLFLESANPQVRTVLSTFLQSTSIRVFAITTPDEYHKHVKVNAALDSMFEKITVDDATEQETLSTLMVRYHQLSQQLKGKVHITYRALTMLLRLTARYIGNGGMPGKALDVLEDAIITARNDKKEFVLEQHIRKAISLKAHVDVEEVSDDEKQKLLRLEDALRVSIVGQEQAITTLVSALKRARLDIHSGTRPLGTFLFLGPTGVGKTHTAKILTNEYFGTSDSLIRVDMNEYGTEDSVAGIIGDPNPTVEGTSYLSKRVQDHPFSLILLDEIEKAHPKVLNVFLQILDEGHLTDSRGNKTDFRNTIIIATSNAGALFIRDFVQEHRGEENADFKQSLIDTILQERTFSPEFLNRFDDIILYYPMSIKEAIKIALIMLDGIVHDIAEKKGFTIQLEEDVVAEIVKNGYSVEFGAREMRRVIVDVIENFLADYLLQHDVKRGESIHIARDDVQSYLPKG